MEWLIGIALLGLIIGSFLNVVILRLPRMLLQTYDSECRHHLGLPSNASLSTYNLLIPPSHCPFCKHTLGILENIPLLSFIFLKGQCKHCHHKIGWRYPLVELLTAILSVITAYHFGLNYSLIAALFLTWTLITLTVIDIDHQLLPDSITIPLLWVGLFCNLIGWHVSLSSAVLGAIIGYLFLWSIYWIFKILTGKDGMGYGDFKLLAALGAWLGWMALPQIILIAALSGALVGISLIVLRLYSRSNSIPFGPFLALAGWIALIWGDKINQFYLSLVHLL